MHVHGHLAHHLGGITVELDLVVLAQLAYFCKRLHCPDFVVDAHDADEGGLAGPDGSLQLLEAHEARVIHPEICDIKALGLQPSTAVENALVLGLCRDHVLLLGSVEPSNALNCDVVAFSRT